MSKIKNIFREWYQPHESFVVRNPLFPMEVFFDWKTERSKSPSENKQSLRRSLREFYLQPIAQEALYIASPDLYEQLQLWIDDKIEKPDKKEKTELSLVKYMIRMCTRCTPYGLFASCSAGFFLDASEMILSDRNSLQRYGRLDMDYVCELHSHLLNQKEISEQLHFSPNTSLYRVGNQWRYIEYRYRKETGRSYHLVEIDHSEYLEKIISKARDGSTKADLAETISDAEISIEEATGFIEELITSQVLVDELEPTVTGEEYFFVLLKKLKSFLHTDKYVEKLENVRKEFVHIKNFDLLSKKTFYKNIIQHLQQLDIPLHLKTLIQVDSYRPVSCSLNLQLNEELLKGASLLQFLSSGDTKDSFAEFKSAFINRYEGQLVPLVEVLDTESGIGYGKFTTVGMEVSPLIDKLQIDNGPLLSNGHQASTETFKWQLYQQAIAESKIDVSIDDNMIEEFAKKEYEVTNMPDSIAMMVKINATSADSIDKGNYTICLNAPSGPSGGNLLGRFCHLSPSLEKLTRNILEKEEAYHSDRVYAEIVHLPESRIGNILMRPVLRKYEIPYLCGSSVEKEFQIPVQDLLVGIENNRVVLYSKRLNKEIVPRLTTAHNFSMTTLPVYQFLCDLQYQQTRSVGWHWGVLDAQPFLPRVSYGKFILSKARWIITKDELKLIDQKNDESIIDQFENLIKTWRLPDFVLLTQGDNELLLHLKNIFCIKLLIAEINKGGSVILTESFDKPETCWAKSPEGHHASEFIFTFSKKVRLETDFQKPQIKPAIKNNIKRFFPVGSEWLYAKVYCGTKTGEKILTEVIHPLTNKLLSENVIDKFFFLRYNDSGHHIRIRFHNTSQKDFWKEVIQRLQEEINPLLERQLVHNLQYETYQREVERYGVDTMHYSEEIFFHQSSAILNFISLLDGDEGEQYRWQVALKAIDLFLEAFNYDTLGKRNLLKILDRSFGEEFKIKSAEQKMISERFSTHKQLVYSILNDELKSGDELKEVINIFKVDCEDYKNCVSAILNTSSIQKDAEQLNQLMPAYLHMFINRLFVSNQRKNELIIYNYLFRFYESRIAKERKSNNISGTSFINA